MFTKTSSIKNALFVLICIITIIAIYIILHVGLGWLCPIGVSNNYIRINDVLLNLSYSYLAASLFFLLVEYFPSKLSSARAFNICKQHIVNLYIYMSEIVAMILLISENSKPIEKISLGDLENIKFYKPSYKNLYYKTTLYKNGKEAKTKIKEKGVVNLLGDLYSYSKKIDKTITKISMLPSSSNLTLKLTEILSEIASSGFLRMCLSFERPLLENKEHSLGSFDSDFYSFLKQYIKLGKFNFTKHSYHFELLNQDEIEKMNEERAKVIETLTEEGLRFDNQTFYKNHIKYKFRDGKLI